MFSFMIILQGICYVTVAAAMLVWMWLQLKQINEVNNSQRHVSAKKAEKLEHMKNMFFRCLKKISKGSYPEEVAERRAGAQIERLCQWLSFIEASDVEALVIAVHEHVITQEPYFVSDFAHFCKEFIAWESTTQNNIIFAQAINKTCSEDFFTSSHFDPTSLKNEKRSLANVKLIVDLTNFHVIGSAVTNSMINRLFSRVNRGKAGLGGWEALRELFYSAGTDLSESNRNTILDSGVLD